MQLRYLVSLFAAAALPVLAQAQPPVSAPELGAAQGVFDYCSKVDPGNEKQFDRQAKLLFKGMTERSVQEARHSAAFQNAHKTLESVLAEIPLSDAIHACKSIV
jgi:hypothetical protein